MESKLRTVLEEFMKSQKSEKKEKRKYTIDPERKAKSIEQKKIKSAFRNAAKAAAQFEKNSDYLDQVKDHPFVETLKSTPYPSVYSDALFRLNRRFNSDSIPSQRDSSDGPPIFSSTPVTLASSAPIPITPLIDQDSMPSKRKADDEGSSNSKEFHNNPLKYNVADIPITPGTAVSDVLSGKAHPSNKEFVPVSQSSQPPPIDPIARVAYYRERFGK
jgi:hypothetical protein